MAKRKQTPVTQTDSSKIEGVQSKVTVQITKAANGLNKLMIDGQKELDTLVERLEEFKHDFKLEEVKMTETREAHKTSMEELESSTKESAEEILDNAKTQAEEMVKNSQNERDSIVSDKNTQLLKLVADYTFKKAQEIRLYNEAILTNKEGNLSNLLAEFDLARISSEKLADLKERLSDAENETDAIVKSSIAAATTSMAKDHQMVVVKLESTHAQEVAQYTPRITALEQRNDQLKLQVAQYKEMMDANREAQVQMSSNMKADIVNHFDSKK